MKKRHIGLLLATALGACAFLPGKVADAMTFNRGDFKVAPGHFPGCGDNSDYARTLALLKSQNTTGHLGDAITFRGKLYATASGSVHDAKGTLGSTWDAYVVEGRPWKHSLAVVPQRTSGTGYFDVQVCGYMTTSRTSGGPPAFLPTNGDSVVLHHTFGFGVEANPVPFQMAFTPEADDTYYMYWIVYVMPRAAWYGGGGTYSLTIKGN